MKKLILMMLLVVGGVMTVSADGVMWLRSNLKSGSWNENLSEWQFTKQWDGSQDIYEITIPASKIIDKDTENVGDLYFRLYRESSNYETCPYENKNYTYEFSNGQNETYSATSGSDFQGTSGAFCIKHTEIKASEYKITVYLKYEDPWKYYIKVDIVSMPATVSSAGYATFSCDRALDLSGVPAYYASAVSNKKVVLSKTTGKVPAGTGLLLVGEGEYNIPVVATSAASAIDGNLLIGTPNGGDVAASTEGSYNYMLANTNGIGFYNVASATTSGAGKAYLHTTTQLANESGNESGNNSRAAWVFLDDETTGINAVQNVQNSDIIYDLQGRVAKTGKAGLYIKNGKKYFVK